MHSHVYCIFENALSIGYFGTNHILAIRCNTFYRGTGFNYQIVDLYFYGKGKRYYYPLLNPNWVFIRIQLK